MSKYSKETEQMYDRIVDVFEEISIEDVTVLTGNNGSGKSLIRTQIPFKVKKYMSLDDVKQTTGLVASTSMAKRTGSNADWGALSGIMRDTEWVATSQNTYHSLKGLFHAVFTDDSKVKYIIIDEFEIGCGEETIWALCNYINRNIKKARQETQLLGALIITHSRLGAKKLRCDKFINMEGLNKKEW